MKLTRDSAEANLSKISDEFIEQVAQCLPEQPWPTGIHREVAERLSVKNSQISEAIKELIRQGRFRDQVDGELVDPEETTENSSPSDGGELEEQS